MKKRFINVLCLLVIFMMFVFFGCSQAQTQLQSISSDFSADFIAQFKNDTYTGRVSCTRQGLITITVKTPETLSGLSVKYNNSQLQLCEDNLVCSADEAYLPETSFPSILKSVLDAVRNGRYTLVGTDDNESTYSLLTDAGSCMMKTEENYLKAVSVNDTEFNIEFDNVSVN